jgi:hypothetical protein
MTGFATPTLRIIWGGSIGTDIWRTGIGSTATLTGPDGFGPNNVDCGNLAAAILSTELATWWTALKAKNTSSVSLTDCWVYFYGTGDTVADSVGRATQAAVPGTGTTNVLPLRTCSVVSMRTGAAGRSQRGRAYSPLTGQALDTAGQISPSTATDAIASAWQALLQAINARSLSTFHMSGPHFVSVLSRAKWQTTVITQITVDSMPDSQRRRTNKDTASYTKALTI